jgi:hypothetical protein
MIEEYRAFFNAQHEHLSGPNSEGFSAWMQDRPVDLAQVRVTA